jgi:2-methylcitrate dehydratase PrpD
MPDDARAKSAVAADAQVADFVDALTFDALPHDVVRQAQRCLLDLIGVAGAGTTTRMSAIARDYAATHLCGGERSSRILFDGRRSSSAGAAFAGATTIDSIDAHDGHPFTKGHAGVAIFPALLALADVRANDNRPIDAREFLTCLVLGYEIATRAGVALHASVPDYHCSGAWSAIGCAAVGARLLGLYSTQTREALGVAEYFGPRGQILRTCAQPSMVKDGSGWGAHAGVSAAWLAREGFTGAPATTIESDGQRALWTDLGSHWRIREQYFKPYPVCRWAQPAIEATLALQRMHRFAERDIAGIAIETFREAVALGADCPVPRTTEDAQYSLPYPVAAAVVFGRLGVGEINLPALADGRVQRLLRVMTLSDDRAFSERFPAERWARVEIRLHDGRLLRSEPAQARGDPERPLSDAELREKFFSLAEPVLGPQKAQRIERAVSALSEGPTLHVLLDALLEPVA